MNSLQMEIFNAGSLAENIQLLVTTQVLAMIHSFHCHYCVVEELNGKTCWPS